MYQRSYEFRVAGSLPCVHHRRLESSWWVKAWLRDSKRAVAPPRGRITVGSNFLFPPYQYYQCPLASVGFVRLPLDESYLFRGFSDC